MDDFLRRTYDVLIGLIENSNTEVYVNEEEEV